MALPPKLISPFTDREAATAYSAWQKGPAIGCSFARRMSLNPGRHQRAIEVVRGTAPAAIAPTIDALMRKAIASPEITSVAVLVPEVNSLQRLARVAQSLGRLPEWSLTYSGLPQTPGGPMVAFHLTRQIPFDSSTTCPSEVLVLGRFLVFPATRRAPTNAFEIFVGQPRATDPKNGTPTTKANLAHIDLHYPSQTGFESAWESARAGRAASLGVPLDVPEEDDLRAKAKVSLVVPAALGAKLGCST